MPNLRYCDKASVVSAFAADSWQRAAFADFAAVLESARIRILRLSGSAPALPAPLTRYLPQQGSIELQRDAAGKEHAFHTHERDEVILILEGGLRFYWEEGERICRPGDEIRLPAHTRHGSIALEDGAVYMIACPPDGLSS